jgi:hypothetical protein
MDFKKIAEQAKAAIDKRGGTESVKEDVGELKDIAGGGGSLVDKAKEAADALKEPGESSPATQPPPPDPAPAGDADPERHGRGGEHRGQGKHRGNRQGGGRGA